MREFKFRAWDKKYKRMSQPFGISGEIACMVRFLEENGKLDSIPIEVVACERDRFVIMQFSGLKDLNEEEVFEGDIVKQTVSGKIFVVKYDLAWGGFSPFFSVYEGYKVYKVIGNIYQNPELLGNR